MARYEGRHRNAPAPSTAPRPNPATPSARSGRVHPETAPAVPRSPRPVSHGAAVASGVPDAKGATQGARRAFDPTRSIPVTPAADRAASAKSAAGPDNRRSSSAQPHGTRSSRHHKPSARRRHVGRPILAGALALGLGASGFAYAKATNLIAADAAAFVVGSGVVAQTDELARASTVDTTYRAAASVSRNERRTAIAATGLRDAAALEVKKKKEAARAAAQAKAAAERAQAEKERQQAVANARNDPKGAARVLMADYGWTSDAQYNCL